MKRRPLSGFSKASAPSEGSASTYGRIRRAEFIGQEAELPLVDIHYNTDSSTKQCWAHMFLHDEIPEDLPLPPVAPPIMRSKLISPSPWSESGANSEVYGTRSRSAPSRKLNRHSRPNTSRIAFPMNIETIEIEQLAEIRSPRVRVSNRAQTAETDRKPMRGIMHNLTPSQLQLKSCLRVMAEPAPKPEQSKYVRKFKEFEQVDIVEPIVDASWLTKPKPKTTTAPTSVAAIHVVSDGWVDSEEHQQRLDTLQANQLHREDILVSIIRKPHF